MRKTLLIASLALASSYSYAAMDSTSPTVMSNFSYDYVEARIGASPTTFGAGLSTSIHPNAHAIIRVDSQFEGDYDLAAGDGFHAPINNWADFTGEMLLRALDSEESDYRDSKNGMELNLGVRQWLGPQLEVGAKVGYLTLDNNDDWLGAGYMRFHSTELFSVGAELRINDTYDDQLMLSARFKY
jgi:hypothetical protein